MEYSHFIRQKTHYSACSTNKYWMIYMTWKIHNKTVTHHRQLNQCIYSYQYAVDDVARMVKKYGVPYNRPNPTLSDTYSKNYRLPRS